MLFYFIASKQSHLFSSYCSLKKWAIILFFFGKAFSGLAVLIKTFRFLLRWTTRYSFSSQKQNGSKIHLKS